MNSENRIERIAKSIEAGSPYYSLINYLINETGDKFDLKIDIGRKLSGSTYVVHHIHGKEYGHEIHQKMSSAKKNEIIQSLEA